MSNVTYKRERHVPFSGIYKDTNHITQSSCAICHLWGRNELFGKGRIQRVNPNPHLLHVFYKIVAERGILHLETVMLSVNLVDIATAVFTVLDCDPAIMEI